MQDPIRAYYDKKHQLEEQRWFPAARFVYNLVLAVAAVVPMMVRVLRTVRFSYEMNDDAMIEQALNGSYTGTPDGHAFYIRYPLSWVMKTLYEKDPALPGGLWPEEDVNWYVMTIALLAVFAMVCVLFRLLNAFRGNRLLICILFDLAIACLWLPHFANMTFTTAAAFMGCMGLLFFAFESGEEAVRPWNLLLLFVLLGSCWCLRKQCFLMVAPCAVVILLFKYRLQYFRSWKPWVTTACIALMALALVKIDAHTYDADWQVYREYNAERSWLQDYDRIPEYEGNEAFYEEIGLTEEGRDAFDSYTYCMVDGFGPETIHKIYVYVKQQEDPSYDPETAEGANSMLSGSFEELKEQALASKDGALEKFRNPVNISETTVRLVRVLWECLLPLLLLTLLTCRERRWLDTLVLLVEGLAMGGLVCAEWLYLIMNDRFPKRVEEVIWLLTFSIGALMAGQILLRWRDVRFSKVPGVLQLILLVLFLQHNPIPASIEAVRVQQENLPAKMLDKGVVLEYCGEHPDDFFVLKTTSVVAGTTPYDDLHQGNWFMSGSWAAFSPLYEQKLADQGTKTLGTEFLYRDNVYVITKGETNIRRMMGRSKDQPVTAVVVDTFGVPSGEDFYVYKVIG